MTMKTTKKENQKKNSYPKHLHNTHRIPSIQQREVGVLPKQPVVMSDGYKDYHPDGTSSLSYPYSTLKTWHQQGSKRAWFRAQLNEDRLWGASEKG